jgi:aminoglycoside phosphotransferase (APT) family kinase protein
MVYFDDKDKTASRLREPSMELIQEICLKELGQSAREIHAIVGQGIINKVFRLVATNGDRVILRLCGRISTETSRQNYDKEIWCLRFLKECEGFRVPIPLGRGREQTFEYMLEEYIDGRPGNSQDFNQLEIWQRLGQCAAVFNARPITGYGADLDLSAGRHFAATWQEVVQQNLDVIFRDDYWVRSGSCTALQVTSVNSLLQSLCDLHAPAGLVHIDLAPKNCIIEPQGSIAVIDWEMVEGGPTPYSQLAAVAGWWGTESDEYRGFRFGYEQVAGPVEDRTDIIGALAVLNSMHSVRWAQDNDQNLVSEYSRSAAFFIDAALRSRKGE